MMRAQALHGVMPGLRAPRPHAVPLRMAARAPYRPVRSTPQYRPALLANPRSPKMAGSFDVGELPMSLALMAGGAGGMYLAGVLPAPIKQVIFVAGIGAATLGILNLFSGPAYGDVPVKIEPRFVPPGEEVTERRPGHLAEGLVLRLDEAQVNTGSTTRSMFVEQEYEYSVQSNWDRQVSFFAGLSIWDEEHNEIWASRPDDPGPFGRKRVTVPANDTVTKRLQSPDMASKLSMWPDSTTVAVELFEHRDAQEPFMVSPAITIKYAWVG